MLGPSLIPSHKTMKTRWLFHPTISTSIHRHSWQELNFHRFQADGLWSIFAFYSPWYSDWKLYSRPCSLRPLGLLLQQKSWERGLHHGTIQPKILRAA